MTSSCHHGIVVTTPCPSCEAEGYHRCEFEGCRKLFVPKDGKEKYHTTYCRNAAAHQRERAREQVKEMAREGI